MTWSEDVGGSILLPANAVENGGVPYLVIGDKIPDEIIGQFSAAIVFWSGTREGYSTSPVVYWAFGINMNGDLSLVGLWGETIDPGDVNRPPTFRYNVGSIFTVKRTGNSEFGGLEFDFDTNMRAAATIVPRIVSKRSVYAGTVAATAWTQLTVTMPQTMTDTNYVVLANAREFPEDNHLGGARFQVGEVLPINATQFTLMVYNAYGGALGCYVSYVATECNY